MSNKKSEPPTKDYLEWIVAHTSVMGHLHSKSNPPIPCQDSNAVLSLGKGWGIAVTCDGAGSAKNSHIGSKFVSEEAIKLFKEIIIQNDWLEKGVLPDLAGWEEVSIKALKKLRYDLEGFAKENEYSSHSLACTVIIVIFSPFGLMLTHIGDGRAGYRNTKEEWLAMMTPHKGEEANETVFITSNNWLEGELKMSGVSVPECQIISEEPTAFTVLSDGCENHSFELGSFNEETQVFVARNKPFKKFFEPLVISLRQMSNRGEAQEEINTKWSNFIASGIPQLEYEPDDKTMIIGVVKG